MLNKPGSILLDTAKTNCLVLMLLSICCTCLHAFADGIAHINRYSSSDGLSDNRVTGIIKDREGFIWVSTWGGINRFDGERFVSFKSNPGDRSSLTSNRIDEVVEDKKSHFLWVKAYDNKSIYRFDKQTHVFTPLENLIKYEPFKDKRFIKILAVSDHKVWLKMADGNVVVINDASGNAPTFQEFEVSNGLASAIYFFHLDKNGIAWISNDKGLFLIKQNPDCRYTVLRFPSSKDNPFRTIVEDEDGTMWISYAQRKIIKLDSSLLLKGKFEVSEGSIHALKFSACRQMLFCTTSKGEVIAIERNGKIRLLATSKNKRPLYNIFQDKSGFLWVESADYGVLKLDGGKLMELFPKRNYGFKPWVINSTIFEDINNRLWVCIQGYQLSFYNAPQRRMEVYDLNIRELNRVFSRVVQGVYYDPDGVLWINTDNGGIERVILQDDFFSQYFINEDEISKAENEVRAVYVDTKNRLWIGTKLGKVLLKAGDKTLYPFGESFRIEGGIHTITQDSKGDFWIGAKGDGIYSVTENERGFVVKHRFLNTEEDKKARRNLVYSIIEEKGKIWVGTFGGGLVLIENQGNTFVVKTNDNFFKNYPLENYGRIRTLAKDRWGNIWIGSTEGLVIYNPNSKQTEKQYQVYRKQIGDVNSLGGNDVHYIYEDSRAQMWVLTSSGGLNKALGENPMYNLEFKNYSKKQGLPSDFLLSCVEDNFRNLWIATRNGVSRFSLDKEEFQNYRYYKGLQEIVLSEGAVVKANDGKIIIGNFYGYLAFSPKVILSSQTGNRRENLVFTNFQVNSEDMTPNGSSPLEKDINYTKYVKLRHNQNVIGLEFAALGGFSSNERSFSYRLLGFDDVWRSTERQRKIVYTNLPPGHYTFQIKSLAGDGYHQSISRSLNIEILPPFWKTWWAYAGYIILLIVLLFFVRKVALNILSLRQKIAVEHRLAQLKDDFFTHVSHELRTPLTLMLNPTEEVLKNEKLSDIGKEYLNVVIKNAKRMVRFVNQLLDLRNLHEGNQELDVQEVELVNFIHSNLDYFKESVSKRQLLVQLISNIPEVFVKADKDKLEVVIYNLLSNAIKYSPDGGTITINLNVHPGKQLSIQIADEGPGVEEEELDAIFNLYYEGKNRPVDDSKGSGIGLAFAKKIIELHKGEIYALNVQPRGFCININLPLSEDTGQVTRLGGQENKEKKSESFEEDISYADTVATNEDRKSVLVIEDNDDLRRFICRELSSSFHVLSAKDGEEGLVKTKKFMPDLIVSDIMMPKVDGIEVLKSVKSDISTSHIPVVLLSAKSSVQSQIEGLEFGADYYISKPFSTDLFRTVISTLLKRRSQLSNAILSGEFIESSNTEELSLTPSDKLFLEKVVAIVEEKLIDDQFNIDTVAESLGVSRSVFFRKFKSLTNVAPIEFVKETRLKKATEIMKSGETNISTIAYSVGFNNPKYFSTCFKAQFGLTPSQYINKFRAR